MSAQHTPGPWSVKVERSSCEGVNITFEVDSAERVSICRGQSQEHLRDGINEDECRANAHLVAAAPELLQVVCEMFSLDEALIRDICGSEFVERAGNAIAKAIGASHG